MKNKLLLFIAVLSIIGNVLLLYVHYRKKKLDRELKLELTHRFNRQDIYALFPTDSNSIVFLGDSQTEFFDFPDFFQNNHIKNRGIARDRTFQILERVHQVTMGHPKKIFIQGGVNDLSLNKEQNINSNISVDSCFNNIKKIILLTRQQSPSSAIYYQNTIPFSYVIKEIKDLNERTKVFCKENNIVYIDLFTDFLNDEKLNPDYDCGDGLHLNGKGYSKWKNIIEKYVNE